MSPEVTTDLAMLERLAAPSGKDVVDIGCGAGGLARALARRGARVTGIEVSEGQLAAALAHGGGEPEAGVSAPTYRIGAGQSLPLEDKSVDLAIFMRTLHHVPSGELTAALREAWRVLRSGGAVYVAEPLAQGDYFELTALIEDEVAVRRAAAEAIASAGAVGLEKELSVVYDVRFCVADVAAFRARNVAANPDRGPIFDARAEEIGSAFARLGDAGERPGERCFRQPMRADVLRKAGDGDRA